MEGSYSKYSAAGSKLKRWILRPRLCACVTSDEQKVDFPAPAGPKMSLLAHTCHQDSIAAHAVVVWERLLHTV